MNRKATLDALFTVKAKNPKGSTDLDDSLGPIETKSAVQPPSPGASPELTAVNSTSHPELTAVNSSSATAAALPDHGGRIRSGAIGAMGASLQQLQEVAREAESLRQSMADAENVVALDPALIDSAPVADRFLLENDAAEATLRDSIRDSGQQVPVLVRPHPSRPGRWQAAYGHRRIRACRALGKPVNAIVRPLSDTALAIAQGKENLERRDLSFIERVFFAAGLEEAGFDRGIVMQALGVHKADVSRYVAIAAAVPISLVRLIGSAPKAGRARWMALAEALAARGGERALRDLLEVLPQLGAFQASDSDARFQFVLKRLSGPPKPAGDPPLVTDSAGRAVAAFRRNGRTRQIEINEQFAPGFADHVAAALPELYRQWRHAPAGEDE